MVQHNRWRSLEQAALPPPPPSDELDEVFSSVLDEVLVVDEVVKTDTRGLQSIGSTFGNLYYVNVVSLRTGPRWDRRGCSDYGDPYQTMALSHCMRKFGPRFVQDAGKKKELALAVVRN